jgi:membrane protein
VIVGILLALWSASRGTSGMITALDIAYDEEESRSFFRFNLIAIGLTLGLIVSGLVVIALVAGVPAVVAAVGIKSTAGWLALILEWPLLIVFVMTILAVLYRYAPDREMARWQWISPGAITATLLWVIASILFSVYVSHFGSYNKTYGSLGAIIVLLTWLWLSFYVVLFGAEINAEAERQTRCDSTEGPPEPMGKRGAVAADTLGDAPPKK